MDIVQQKLQLTINNGQLNSFDRLSNLFAGNSLPSTTLPTSKTNTDDNNDGDVVMATSSNNTKSASKIPTKKSNHIKKAYSQKMIGQYGLATTRKVNKEKQRAGKIRSRVNSSSGRSSRSSKLSTQGRLRSSSKKRGGK